MRKLKVYGGNLWTSAHGQCRGIVAATSKKKVAELTGMSLNYINDYWCVTGNIKELEIALGKPLTIFYCKNNFSVDAEYKELLAK